jgi:hypothetical protein
MFARVHDRMVEVEPVYDEGRTVRHRSPYLKKKPPGRNPGEARQSLPSSDDMPQFYSTHRRKSIAFWCRVTTSGAGGVFGAKFVKLSTTPITTPTQPEAAHERSHTTASKISRILFVCAGFCDPTACNGVRSGTSRPEYLSTGYRGFESLLLRFRAVSSPPPAFDRRRTKLTLKRGGFRAGRSKPAAARPGSPGARSGRRA